MFGYVPSPVTAKTTVCMLGPTAKLKSGRMPEPFPEVAEPAPGAASLPNGGTQGAISDKQATTRLQEHKPLWVIRWDAIQA